MPALACGTILIVRANSTNRKTTTTIATITPAIAPLLLFGDERRSAPYLHHLHAGPRLDHVILIQRPRGPDLAVNLHTADALRVRDPLQHDRRLAHQRSGTGAQLRRRAQMRPGH